MHTDSEQLREPSPESLKARYEVSAVNVRGLVYFVIGLIITAAVVHVGIWILLEGYQRIYERSEQPRSALTDPKSLDRAGLGTTVATLPGPPAPRLQPSQPDDPFRVPSADLQLMLQKEDEFFENSLGWKINRQTHVQSQIPADVIDQVIRDETARQRQAAASQPGQH
jgi:hypothetical protein